MKDENVARALGTLCVSLFENEAVFPCDFWAESFPMDVILYALLETRGKVQRTPGMVHRQIVGFANNVMERRLSAHA